MLKLFYHKSNSDNPEEVYTARIDHYADECPLCNITQMPEFVIAHYPGHSYMNVVFRCQNQSCGRFFISYYYGSGNGYDYMFYKSVPSNLEKVSVDKEIQDISEKYEEIYNQALKAEHYELTEIAGMGYRKALEFLIKDYLINFKGKEPAEISHKMLGNCIKNEIENPQIQELAEKTAWIGNDETHYDRRHNDKNIEDLKKLLSLTLHWITYEIQTKEVLDSFKK
jgi:hypothetical protein